jgi:hypothetical protein
MSYSINSRYVGVRYWLFQSVCSGCSAQFQPKLDSSWRSIMGHMLVEDDIFITVLAEHLLSQYSWYPRSYWSMHSVPNVASVHISMRGESRDQLIVFRPKSYLFLSCFFFFFFFFSSYVVPGPQASPNELSIGYHQYFWLRSNCFLFSKWPPEAAEHGQSTDTLNCYKFLIF